MTTARLVSGRASVVLPAVLTLLMAGAGCSRSPEHYVEIGNDFVKAGKLEDAILNYQKAIQKNPNFGEAYYRRGLAEIKFGRGTEAYDALSTAARLLTDREDVQTEFGRVALSAYLANPNRPKALYDQLTKLSTQMLVKNPRSFDAFRIQGFLALGDRKPADAVDLFKRANEVRPMDPNLVLMLVQALIQVGQTDEAEKLALELIQKDKKFPATYDVLFRYYLGKGRRADAEEISKTKVRNLPDDPDAALQLAAFYAANGNRAEMEKALLPLLEHRNKMPEARLKLGDFYRERGDVELALKQYDQGRRDHPDQALVYWRRASELLWAKGRRDEAIHLWDETLKENPDNEKARALRAELLLASGNTEKALQELQIVIKKDPKNASVHHQLGQTALAKGDVELARTQFREALALDPNSIPACTAMAGLCLASKEYKEALRYADKVVSLGAASPRIRLIRATALMGDGRFPESRDELQGILSVNPSYADARLQLGLLEIAQKRFPEAERIFQQAYRAGQPDLRPAEGLAELYWATNQPAKAFQLWANEIQAAPKSQSAHKGYARAALRVGKLDVAISEYQRLILESPNSAELYTALGEAFMLKADTANAKALFQKARDLTPGKAYAASSLAYLEQLSGDTQAEANYRKALAAQPNDAIILNNLAYLLAEKGGDLEEAVRLAEKARQLQPGNPEFADTLGWVYLKKNMVPSALQVFGNLATRYPKNAQFRYHYGVALLRSGDRSQAKKELEKALASQPSQADERSIRVALEGL